jgi:hypothetical protein
MSVVRYGFRFQTARPVVRMLFDRWLQRFLLGIATMCSLIEVARKAQ